MRLQKQAEMIDEINEIVKIVKKKDRVNEGEKSHHDRDELNAS